MKPPRLGPRRRSNPALTFAKLRDVLSPHCGIVTELQRFSIPHRGGPRLYGYAAQLEAATTMGYARFRAIRGEQTEVWRTGAEGRQGTRVAFDRTRAFVRAVGEALERYACCTYDPSGWITAPWREVKDQALDPRTCQLPSAEELAALPALAPFDPHAPMRWTWGWSLRDGRPILVPAQMVYVMYNPVPGEPRLAAPTSTGWAIHHTPEEAIHAALREVVERDAFALAWLNRLPVPTLDVGALDAPDARAWIEGLRSEGTRAQVLVTTTDFGVPSFALAISDPRPGRPAFQLTLAAHPDPLHGLRQAVEEGAMMRMDLTARLRAGLVAPPERMEDVAEMPQHAEYYLDPSHLAPVEWLLEPRKTLAPADLPSLGHEDVWEETRSMVRGIARAGHDVIYVDGTPPDLREAGWSAAKVLVPGSVRHEYGHGVRYLACPRLYDAPVRMGHRARPSTPAELNTDVHPYS